MVGSSAPSCSETRPVPFVLGGVAALLALAASPSAQAAATSSGFSQHSTSCPAENARFNGLTPYKTTLDFVPVTTDDSLGFHVAYSGRTPSSGGNSVAFNVGIFLFPLDDGGLLVFGGGYGDPKGAGSASNDAAYDAANVDAYVRQCLGRSPASTPIEFVSPHWHGDHINPEFLRELGNLGYPVRSIWFHEADDSYVRSYYNWTQAELAKFRTFPGKACNVEIGSFASTLGKVWFVARSGHAPGAIDLVLDVRDNPQDRVLVLGSEAGGNCPTSPSGVRWTHSAHGNAQVTTQPEAVPYGCGVNASGSLRVVAGEPKIGTTITVGVDDPRSDVAPGRAFPMLFSSNRPDPLVPCGPTVQLTSMVRPYEVLIDALNGSGFSPPLVGPVWLGPGQPSQISAAIPREAGAVGTSVYLQAAMFEFTAGPKLVRTMLTEGLELRVGR